MKTSHLLALYKISEMGATHKEVVCSTSDVAKGIGSSQQTASRRLIEMEKLGMIEKSWTPTRLCTSRDSPMRSERTDQQNASERWSMTRSRARSSSLFELIMVKMLSS